MLTLLPYVQINDEWIVSDDLIKALFYTMQRDKINDVVFYDGTVKDAESFVKFMKDSKILPVIILKEINPVGFAWLSNLSHAHAFAHFAYFKEVWGRDTINIGKKLTSYWFSIPGSDGKQLIKTLLGVTPTFNKKAISYVKKLGWTILGEIPEMYFNPYLNENVDVVLSFKKDT